MASPFSAAVLRAISFPSHLRSPFFHPKKDPSHFLHRSVRRAADGGLRCIASPNSPMNLVMYRHRSERNGAARSTSENWPAGFHSSRANFAGEGGKRKGRGQEMDSLHRHQYGTEEAEEDFVGEGGKRKGRGQEMNSLHRHQYGTEQAEEDMNGGYKQLLRQEEEVSNSRLLTLPTVLTLGRVAAVPLLVSTYHMNGSLATTTTTGIFLLAAFTDWLDGYLARKMQLGTTFGAFLDPVADKLMVAATLILLCTKPLEVAFVGVVPWILTVPAIAIIGREITMSAVREWAASQNSCVLEAVAVNNLGKWKTATQMTALTILLLTREPSLTGPGFLVSTGVFLLYVSAGLALWSLAVYMRKIWRFMIK